VFLYSSIINKSRNNSTEKLNILYVGQYLTQFNSCRCLIAGMANKDTAANSLKALLI